MDAGRTSEESPSADLAIGLDIGGTKILGGLVRASDGQVLAEERVATPAAGGASGIMAGLVAATETLLARARAADWQVAAVGVSSAGHVDWETGRVVDGTPNIPEWAGTEVGADLQRALGLPVCCDNDGNAAAFGEAWRGAGRGKQSLVALTLGTGFGAGIYDRGHILRGRAGGGGELGHLILVPDGRPCNCGQRGCVEAYVSGTALAREARAVWGAAADTRYLFDRAHASDPLAEPILDDFARFLALVLVSVFNLADPELILVGGGLASQADLFLPRARRRVTAGLGGKRFSADQILLAELGERAGMVGAAGQALARFGPASLAERRDASATRA